MKFIMQNTKQQLTLFFYALSYFTRVPIPASIGFDNKQFHKANAYLPLIGVVIAFVMILAFYLCQLLFSIPVSIILMLSVSLLLTGALHEDGFADCCDGFGGGYDAVQRLKIMKDSQIGSYAGIGLVVIFLLKFNLLMELAEISTEALAISLTVAHVFSRYGALCIMQSLLYVRVEKEGKVQGLAKKLSYAYFTFASLITFAVLLLLSFEDAVFTMMSTAMAVYLLRHLFNKTLAGYSGDCLGFTQQCLELTLLLLLTVVLAV